MTSASTCIPQLSSSHHHRNSRDETTNRNRLRGSRSPTNQSTTNHHLRQAHSSNRDDYVDEDDPLLQLRPDPDNGNIQDDLSADNDMLPRRVPMIVVNERPNYSPLQVDSMRRKLRFFFMNPIEKWKARKQFPWKLLLQVIKIVVITVQLTLFGSTRYSHINFYEDNKVALSHLFLKDWDSSREVEAYPPSQGPYAVYTKSEFHEHIDYIVSRYTDIRDVAIGSYDYVHPNASHVPVQICKTIYKKAVIFGFNESFIFDSEPITMCLDVIPEFPVNGTEPIAFNSQAYFAKNNFTIVFERLINVQVKFGLRYILLKALEPLDSPDCYQLDVTVLFDNENQDGVLRVALEMVPFKLHCHGNVEFTDCLRNLTEGARDSSCLAAIDAGKDSGHYHNDKYSLEMALLNSLNVIVIVICILSFLLCSRAILRAQVLKYEAVKFFSVHFGKKLNVNDKLEFLNMWYVVIIVNDALIVAGSIIKMQLENKVTDGDLYTTCSIFLGTGSLLVWLGVLRYLGFFPKYNILILTMRRAVPDVLRFLLCAIMMYCGFIFCGWLILGPYHIKFRSLSSTAECLFSLINGDDMYATFSILAVKNGLVWWFCRVYMYSFIALFIYVVLSLFIAVIMDTYETIKMHYENGFPRSDLREFAYECRDEISSGIFRQESVDPWGNFKTWMHACCQRRRTRSERQPLLGPK